MNEKLKVVNDILSTEKLELENRLEEQDIAKKELKKELVLTQENISKQLVEKIILKQKRVEVENVIIRKLLAQTRSNEKSFNMLLKSSRKANEKTKFGYENNA